MTFLDRKKYCIYTAIFGSYDDLKEPLSVDPETDYICFTDNEKITSKTYEIRVVIPTNEDPNRSAKIYKVLPHKYLKDYEYSLWIDGSVSIKNLQMESLVQKYLMNRNIALFKHPERKCLYEEYEVCKRYQKDDPQVMSEQIKKYKQDGFPQNYGLAEVTVMLRKHNSPDIIKFNELWWKEISENSKRDQLSFNYVSWKTGIEYAFLDGTTKNNTYIEVLPHRIITNELTTKEYIEICEKYHQLGKDHDALFKEKEIIEKELSEYAEKYHKIGKQNHENNILLNSADQRLQKLEKHYIEAMKQRNNFECQLQDIYRSPKWKIACLIALPFKPFKKVASKISPYFRELYYSIKDINGYKKTFGFKFAKEKFSQLVNLYTKQIIEKYKFEKKDRVAVLFLSDEQSNCYRYRVLNQMEQLDKEKIYVKDVSVNFPRLESLVNIFDVFIFVRPHDTARNIQLAKLIKKKEKIVVFENDDLIFSPNAVKESVFLKNLPKKVKEVYKKGIGTKFVKLANYGLTTTETIRQEMERINLKAFVNRNALNSEIVKISEKVVENTQNDNYVNIGYFSGSKTHDNDFVVVKNSLLKILEKYKNTQIITAGYIQADKQFEKYKDRIVNLPYVNWRDLPKNIKLADINIVPLDLNLFNQAKSELKYFEAGILKIPTIASATDPYKFAIKDGVNGFLAEDEREWFEKLEKLIKDKNLRKKIGEKAYDHSLNNYTAEVRKSGLTKFIIEIAKKEEQK